MPESGRQPAQRPTPLRKRAAGASYRSGPVWPNRFALTFMMVGIFLLALAMICAVGDAVVGQEAEDQANEQPPPPTDLDQEVPDIEENRNDEIQAEDDPSGDASDDLPDYVEAEQDADSQPLSLDGRDDDEQLQRPTGRQRTRFPGADVPPENSYAERFDREDSRQDPRPRQRRGRAGPPLPPGRHPQRPAHHSGSCDGKCGPGRGGPLPFFRPFLGDPNLNESWTYRPWNASWFLGNIWGDELIAGRVGQASGLLAGYRIGLDFDRHWGSEMRFGFSSVRLQYPEGNPNSQDGDTFLWDAQILYYPRGEARLRPFFFTGFGLANFDFPDEMGNPVEETVLGMPFGVGLKYRWGRKLVLRGEFTDNLAFASGSGLRTLHNLSLTVGLEVRFGGPRKHYWPWVPGRYIW